MILALKNLDLPSWDTFAASLIFSIFSLRLGGIWSGICGAASGFGDLLRSSPDSAWLELSEYTLDACAENSNQIIALFSFEGKSMSKMSMSKMTTSELQIHSSPKSKLT